jgi:hypothetical protein
VAGKITARHRPLKRLREIGMFADKRSTFMKRALLVLTSRPYERYGFSACDLTRSFADQKKTSGDKLFLSITLLLQLPRKSRTLISTIMFTRQSPLSAEITDLIPVFGG